MALLENPNKLRKKTLRERIYDEAVHRIVSGELLSGEWICEKKVTVTLGVSRSPFREAMVALANEGLIESKSYRGFYVRSFSRREAEDVYELYKSLECFAVELAVPQMCARDIGWFEHILSEAAAALRRGDMKTCAVHDREFYEIIARQSSNVALMETRKRLARQIQLFGTIENESREFAERAEHRRQDVVEAFKAHDVPRAVFLTRALISDAQAAVLARFQTSTVDQ